jgi:hypothetical protein
MESTSRSRLRWWWVPTLALAAVFLLNQSVTRGYVSDDDRHPLAGAVVLLADSDSLVRTVRTDAAGYFRFAHAPFARRNWSLLICAPGHSALYSPNVSSALIRSRYGIDSYSGSYPITPADLGWQAPVVPACPAVPDPPAD